MFSRESTCLHETLEHAQVEDLGFQGLGVLGSNHEHAFARARVYIYLLYTYPTPTLGPLFGTPGRPIWEPSRGS